MTQTPHPADGGQSGPSGSAAPPHPGPAPSGPSPSNRFWDDISSTGLRRDQSRQWFAGVCSGIARRVDVDPVLIRAAFIALTLFGGFGIVAYLVAWLFLPDDGGRIMARDAINRDGNGGTTGAIILSVVTILVVAGIVFGDNGFLVGWGIIPIAIVGWLFWRHQQRVDSAPAWSSATPVSATGPVPPHPTGHSMYAATSTQAPVAPNAPVAPTGSGHEGWQPPPAPPVTPRSWVPVAPPPPPRPRRRSAGFAGFALTLGMAAVGYGLGLMLDGPLDFTGSEELLGVIVALGAAALTTLLIGLSGRRSILSAGLVLLLGLGATAAAAGETALGGDRGIRTWTPVLAQSTTSYQHGAGRTTLDLRPLFASLTTPAVAPVPSIAPSPAPGASAPVTPAPTASAAPATPVAPVLPQRITVEQGAGEMVIIVPPGATADIRARSDFGEVRVLGDLPAGTSDRDDGANDGPSETLTLALGAGAPTVTVRADITFGQITIKEG